MWIDWIGNKETVYGIFGQELPELHDLLLMQIIIIPEIACALEFKALPSAIPPRWTAKGVDKLQLRMYVGLLNDLNIRQGLPQGMSVALEIGEKQLRLVSHDGEFELGTNFGYLHMTFFPYRAADYEFSPDWYHP